MARFLIHLALCVSAALFPHLIWANKAAKRNSQPNIVFILTDDQDLHLNSLEYMPNLQTMLMKEGTYFSKHYGHISICCPARATIWTGKHGHNTNVTTVWPGIAGAAWPQIQNLGWYKRYLPVWMQAVGYNTYYSGKIFNAYTEENYCSPHCLQGWSKADVLYDPSTYYYYNSSYTHFDGESWSLNKHVVGYSTDQIAENVANYIDEVANSDKPFFAVAAPVAIHAPHLPKKEYAHLYPDAKVPRTANFNPDNRTGVATTWTLDKLNETNIEALDFMYRSRLQALKSVDDLVATLVNKLDETGVLDNTYILFTTDNGYHIGNHRLQGGKYQCFEEDINLPFVIRGPDVAKNKNTSLVTGHIDLAPTIMGLTNANPLELAGAVDVDFDGTPITFPLETEEDFTRNVEARGDATHIEFWGPFGQEGTYKEIGLDLETHVQTYKALRIQGPGYNLMYSVWCQDSAHELYDMSWDSQQMTNLHPDAPSENGTTPYSRGMDTVLGVPTWNLIHRLDALVLVLKTCSGEECRWPWKQLHPNGEVNNLQQALHPKWDNFYRNSYAVAKVGWVQCYGGLTKESSSTLYSIENEKPVWLDQKVVRRVRSTGARLGAVLWSIGAAVVGSLLWLLL